MNEHFDCRDDLDLLIAQALAEEPVLQAPPSLLESIEARLDIAELRAHEERRFRVSMTSLLVIFVAALAVAGLSLWFTNLSVLYSEGVSGGKGLLDYYLTAFRMSFSSYQGTYSLAGGLFFSISTVVILAALQIHKMPHSD